MHATLDGPAPEPTTPRTPLQTFRAIFPFRYLGILVIWFYPVLQYLLAPDSTLFHSEIAVIIFGAFALLTLAILAIGLTGNYIRLKQGILLTQATVRTTPRWLIVTGSLVAVGFISYNIYTTPPTYS